MNEQNKRDKKMRHYFAAAGLVLLFFIAFGGGIFENKKQPKAPNTTGCNKNEVAYPYRVITSLENDQELVAYELHKNDSTDADYGAICSKYPRYSAVIKSINPAKDDYKNYCRSVITDIIKTTGDPTIEIMIYDDNESYTQAEEGDEIQQMSLSKNACDSMQQHIVASYCGFIYGNNEVYGENYVLQFYPQVNNRYSGKEKYEPNIQTLHL